MIEIPHDFNPAFPLSELVEHPENPRRGDVEGITESITVNGWYGAILAQVGTRHVLAGNHRLRAALQLGASTAPVIFLDVSDAEARRILLADNATSDSASYDEPALLQALRAQEEALGSLEGSGYTEDDLASLLASLEGQEMDPPPPQAPPPEEPEGEWYTVGAFELKIKRGEDGAPMALLFSGGDVVGLPRSLIGYAVGRAKIDVGEGRVSLALRPPDSR